MGVQLNPGRSHFEQLPSEIILSILELLTPPHRLCLALVSTRLWNLYKYTSPRIPSLWTDTTQISSPNDPGWHALPMNYPKSYGSTTLLGSLLQEWMAPRYRMVRFESPRRESRNNDYNRYSFNKPSIHELPPYFVRTTWKDSKYWFRQDEQDVFNRYRIYHACYRSGTGYMFPHPKGMGWWRWDKMTRKAIENDKSNFATYAEYESWWLEYPWYALTGSHLVQSAQDLVKSGLGIVENQNLG